MDKNKLMNLIGTGVVTGGLLLIALFFSNGGFANTLNTVAAEGGGAQIINSDSTDLAAQNAQLQEALTIMQSREAEYQARIEEANNMLLNPEPVAYDDYDDEEEDYEKEDYDEAYEDEDEEDSYAENESEEVDDEEDEDEDEYDEE